MSSDRIIISGTVGGVSKRLEINDFVANDKFFTLYIQALLRTELTKEIQDASFFGIGGIHGQPYVIWNGAQGSFDQGKWDFGGYCTHGSVLFPTWHRPYLLLLEQIIQKHALEVAGQFRVNAQEWKAAALQLRLPYWDWTMNSVPPDAVIKEANVTVTGFDGRRIQVENPLIRYRFQGARPFSPPFDAYATTVRHPDQNGKENIPELVRTLRSAQSQITDNTIAMLHMIKDWPNFSNHTDSMDSQTNSLETIHDGIHVDVGGNGHMSDVGVAGFDPIFYLHHANVDRLLSLWSALNTGVEVTKGANDLAGTFTLSPDAILDETTDLSPFWNSNNTFWKSQELYSDDKHYYNTDKLGYTYPDFADTNRDDKKAVGEAAKKVLHGYLDGADKSIFKVHHSVQQWRNWTVRLRVRKFELGRSFSVLVFLGDVPEDSSQWLTSENLVGVNHVFANGDPGRCANCRRNGNIVHEGFVHLNRHLAYVLPHNNSFDPEVVEPYLIKNLNWRVVDTARQPVQVQSLHVTVLAVALSREPDAKLPTVGERTVHHGITAGRHVGEHASD